MKEYWRNIAIASKTLKKGLGLTIKHLKEAKQQRDPIAPDQENYFEKQNAIFTVQYPKEVLPVPTVGRYKLHNEIDDCIVCDKCAKICPVDCIDIEPVRSLEEFGKTSDGTSKRIYAAKFDIDMAKCCFCGLCTTVCPTECLTMTDEYDFSTFDIKDHNFSFANMTPLEILEKKEALAAHQKKKEEEKAKADTANSSPRPKMTTIRPKVPGSGKPKVTIKPKMAVKKPAVKPKSDQSASEAGDKKPSPVKPRIPLKPKIPTAKEEEPKEKKEEEAKKNSPRPKMPMKPKIPPRKSED